MPANVLITVPAFRQQISAATFMTSHSVHQTFASKGIGGGVTSLSFPDIAELRSMFISIWYDSMPQFTHLLFIDNDMGFSPQLPLDMLLFDEPLVGTIYPQRILPTRWAGSGLGTDWTQRRGDFMLVEGVGMGCTLIRRDCITRLIEGHDKIVEGDIEDTIADYKDVLEEKGCLEDVRKMLKESAAPLIDYRIDMHPAKEMLVSAGCKRIIRAFDCLDIKKRGRISEDLSFCIRMGRVGIPTWANIGHRISHVGDFDYAARYLDKVEEAAVPVQSMEEAKNLVIEGSASVIEEKEGSAASSSA